MTRHLTCDWPEKLIPPGTPMADARLMEKAVRALAVRGDTSLATECLSWLNRMNWYRVDDRKIQTFEGKLKP